jgi:hypothetical protein
VGARSTHFGDVVLLRELESDAEAAEERREEGAAVRERTDPQERRERSVRERERSPEERVISG